MDPGPAATELSYWAEVFFAALGVALSVLLPVLVALVKRYWPRTGVQSATDVWKLVLPYVVLGVFSLGVALVVAAAANFDSAEAAVMAGFAWDKTIEVAASVLRPDDIPPVPPPPPGAV